MNLAELKQRATSTAAGLRARYGFVDHAARAFKRQSEADGTLLAGAVTYFAFLSFFPILALAFSVAGRVVQNSAELQQQLTDLITEYLPATVVGPDKIDVNQLAGASTAAGLLGLAGLLYAGLGWVGALRRTLRALFEAGPDQRNVVIQKLGDVATMVMLGLAILVSLAASALVAGLAGAVLALVGLEDSAAAAALLTGVALSLSIGLNLLTLLIVFSRLPGAQLSLRQILPGALLGAAAIELLKLFGGWYIGRTTGNPVFGVFAVVAGLLVWIYTLSVVLVFAASWVATQRPVAEAQPGSVPEPA